MLDFIFDFYNLGSLEKRKKIFHRQKFREVKDALLEDPTQFGRVTINHIYRNEFKLEQLIKQDNTGLPYVICSHSSCKKKDIADRVSRSCQV